MPSSFRVVGIACCALPGIAFPHLKAREGTEGPVPRVYPSIWGRRKKEESFPRRPLALHPHFFFAQGGLRGVSAAAHADILRSFMQVPSTISGSVKDNRCALHAAVRNTGRRLKVVQALWVRLPSPT